MPQIAKILLFVLACIPIHAAASPDIEVNPLKLTVEYESGDKIEISCVVGGTCALSVRTDGKTFRYTQRDLGDIYLTPRRAILYSSPRRDDNYHFSFEVSIFCPVDSERERFDECKASGSAEKGSPLRIRRLP